MPPLPFNLSDSYMQSRLQVRVAKVGNACLALS